MSVIHSLGNGGQRVRPSIAIGPTGCSQRSSHPPWSSFPFCPRPLWPAAGHAVAASRPTIVLVHGAWAGPAGWDEVASGLRKDGYTVVTPTLAEVSIAGDAAIVDGVLDGIPGDKIVVGHSYGGIVISETNLRRNRCSRACLHGRVSAGSGQFNSESRYGLPAKRPCQPPRLQPLSVRLHRSRVLPPDLCSGPEPQEGGGAERRADPDQCGDPRQSVRSGRLARNSVVVRGVGRRPRHRSGRAALDGQPRWRGHCAVRRCQPRRRFHALCGAVREARRAGGRRNCRLTRFFDRHIHLWLHRRPEVDRARQVEVEIARELGLTRNGASPAAQSAGAPWMLTPVALSLTAIRCRK